MREGRAEVCVPHRLLHAPLSLTRLLDVIDSQGFLQQVPCGRVGSYVFGPFPHFPQSKDAYRTAPVLTCPSETQPVLSPIAVGMTGFYQGLQGSTPGC